MENKNQVNDQINDKSPSVTTRSVGVKFGWISALIGIALFLVPVILNQNPFKGVWNWIGTGVSIAIIIIAHKSFKDSGDGFMSYGQGVAIGFWMTLVSTILTLAVMYVYLTFIDTTPMDLFYEEQQTAMEEAGQSDEAIQIAMEWTKKLFWIIGTCAAFFGGMLFTLILTIFTQKKAPEQAF
jgi:hypothetical protein